MVTTGNSERGLPRSEENRGVAAECRYGLPLSFDYKGMRLAFIAILDMTTVVLVSGADGAKSFMAELGKNGNTHARWNKICDKFETYCNQGGGALIASSVGLLLLLLITAMSITKLRKPNPIPNNNLVTIP